MHTTIIYWGLLAIYILPSIDQQKIWDAIPVTIIQNYWVHTTLISKEKILRYSDEVVVVGPIHQD